MRVATRRNISRSDTMTDRKDEREMIGEMLSTVLAMKMVRDLDWAKKSAEVYEHVCEAMPDERFKAIAAKMRELYDLLERFPKDDDGEDDEEYRIME